MRNKDFSFQIVQSGSAGNCLILNDIIALDMGVAYKKVAPYVRALQLVFVGHQHVDHFKESTIRKLAAERPTMRFAVGPFMVEHFIKAGVNPHQIDILDPNKRYSYGAFEVEAFPLHHDVPNIGLKIWMGGESALYAVDTGSIDVDAQGFDWFFIEANHGEAEIQARAAEKLERGEYSYERRAAANHLSYEQAMDFLAMNAGPRSKYVLLHQHKEVQK